MPSSAWVSATCSARAWGACCSSRVRPAPASVARRRRAPPPIPGSTPFFVAVNGQQTGPFDLNALRGQVSGGGLTRDSLVWKQGMSAWGKGIRAAGSGALFSAVPPPVPPQ